MRIWAIGDLHLSFGTPNKEMHVFGENWRNHPEKIQQHWLENISENDLILIPGDISWAMHVPEAASDLNWIHSLPGTKVLIRGNHDYWWSSLKQVAQILPPSIHLIQNNVFIWNNVAIAGARLWDTPEYGFGPYIEYNENPKANKILEIDKDPKEMEKVFLRELGRLELSLKAIPKQAKLRLAMTHYPPIGALMEPSRASALLEKYHIDVCVFGHLHNIKSYNPPVFKDRNGVSYHLTSADFLNFKPKLLFDLSSSH